MGKVVYDKLLNKALLHRHDPLVLMDSNGVYWDVTVDTSGNLVVTRELNNAGTPMGLLLALTYSS